MISETTDPTARNEAGATPGPGADSGGTGRRYLRALGSPRGAVGLGLVVVTVLVSVIGPFLLPYSPNQQGPESLQPPGLDHLLGTDEVGRDLLARVLAGTRVDLVITLIAVPIAAVVGTVLGLVGIVSQVAGALFQRVFDVLLGVPALILGIGVALAIQPGRESVIIAIVVVTVPIFGRQARSALLGQLPLDYVAAAEVLGFSRRRVMLRHILPNIVDVIIVRFAVEMAHAIVIEGGLSVIGLGIQPPQSSLGSMIKDGSSYLLQFPLYALAPVVVVIVLVIGYFMMSDALNRAVLRK